MHTIARCIFVPLVFIALSMAGCATTPPPTYFQLEEPADVQLSGFDHGVAVGIGPLNLPAYLDRPHIVTRATEHRLELSEFNRWVEPLKESMLRVIAVNLSNELETTRVFALPSVCRSSRLNIRWRSMSPGLTENWAVKLSW